MIKSLLIIGYVWPEPLSSAAGRHMLEIISLFIERQWKVTFASPAVESTHQFDLSDIGVQEAGIELNSESFDEWILSLQPDVVIFDRFMMEEQFGWRVAQHCPDAIRILDTEDLHVVRQAREQAVKLQGDVPDLVQKNENTIREIASIFRCDLSLIISEAEIKLLETLFQIDRQLLHYLPFLSDVKALPEVDFNETEGFVFVGTMRHKPNLDAVRCLKRDIWPLIRGSLPDTNLYIAGSYMTKEVHQMHRPSEGFHIIGKVDDLKSFLVRRRISLAPLKYGAGLKGKIIEAMECGLPCITTTTGAEGINAGCDWPGVVSDDDKIFAESAVELYSNEVLWKQARQQGLELLQRRFLKTQHASVLLARIEAVAAGIQLHRDRNFIGKMLYHQSMRSTEYMARWIECKNKKGLI